MATPRGLEPPTSGVTGRRSTLLNYEAIDMIGRKYPLSVKFKHCRRGFVTSHNCTHYQNSNLFIRCYAVKLLLYNSLAQRLPIPPLQCLYTEYPASQAGFSPMVINRALLGCPHSLSSATSRGASDRNRTGDTGIFSPLLYLLSYRSEY